VVRDVQRFKLWYPALKRLVTLTTVLRYRAACECESTYAFKAAAAAAACHYFCLVCSRELHGDGDCGNGVRLYDGHRGNSGDGDSIHGGTAVAVTELTVDADPCMHVSELKNITEHLLTVNELFF